MAVSKLFVTLLGLVAISYGYPLDSNVETQQVRALDELFRTGVESVLQATPEDQLQNSIRIINSQSAPQACEGIFLIFARGTWEPSISDNLGAVAGIPLATALKLSLGTKFSSTGVDYNNGVMGYLTGGDYAGSAKMAQMIEAKATSCPSTKIIAGGYSQGAQVAHNALGKVSSEAKKHIMAVVVFGDPNKGRPIPGIASGNIYTDCAASDPICMGIPLPIGSHLMYGTDATEINKIVEFIKKLA